MTANPLIKRQAEIHVFGEEKVRRHVEWLNGLNFVIASGRPYFVAERQKPDGIIEHFVDRKD